VDNDSRPLLHNGHPEINRRESLFSELPTIRQNLYTGL